MTPRRAPRRPIDPRAVEALRAADPVLRDLIDRVGPFEPFHEPDLWWSLVDAIGSQQLSVKAANTIVGRLRALGDDGEPPTPHQLLALPDDALRACGLSRAKTASVRDLATRWTDGTLDPDRLPDLDDDAVVAALCAVRGIGRWTAEMFLIFTLQRPDVFPVDDLGLRTAVQRAYGLAERPDRATLLRLGEGWRPHRSLATLVLWRSLVTP